MADIIPGGNGSLPAYMTGRRSSGSLIAARKGLQESYSTIGIKDKMWWMKKSGERELIREDPTNPRSRAVAHLDVVIVGVSETNSKAYYEGAFDDERNAPDCSSIDSIYPDVGVPNKQHATCQGCPQNAFGSRAGRGGKPAKACKDLRRIAVVPLYDGNVLVEEGPMLLILPTMSLPNFRRYASELERKGASDIWWVGTRLEFDPEDWRIMFTPTGWVTEQQDEQIQTLRNEQADLIDQILYRAGPTASSDSTTIDAIPGTPPARAQQRNVLTMPSRPQAQQTPEPPPEEEDPEEGEPDAPPAPEPPPPPPAPAAQPQARTSPFQAQAPARGRPPTRVSPQTGRVAPQGAPTPAPMDLESAIDDLFSSTGGKT